MSGNHTLWQAGCRGERACCGERACPALGCEAPPNQAKRGVPDTAQRLALGLLRSPTQDKPARHRESALN